MCLAELRPCTQRPVLFLQLDVMSLHLGTMGILPASMYKKDVMIFCGTCEWNNRCNIRFQQITEKFTWARRKDPMLKAECKMKLKHQLEIGRRLQQLGLFAAATESRTKSHILLQIYKRHFREQPINQR